MKKIQPFDPTAAEYLQAVVTGSVDRLARSLQRKADRADALREAAASENDAKAFKSAEALDREVMLALEVVQSFRQLIDQLQADNDSAWAMVELQDRQRMGLQQQIDFLKEDNFQLRRQRTALFDVFINRANAPKS